MNENIKAYYGEIIKLSKRIEKLTRLVDKSNGDNNAQIIARMVNVRVNAQVQCGILEQTINDRQ